VPESDDVVLERVGEPQDPELQRLARARRDVSEHPSQLEPALAFARSAIELGRRRSDPRLMGQAEAALAPFLGAPSGARARVLQAALLQNRHAFSEALTMLDAILAEAPQHPQAWLTRAVIELVQGDRTLPARAARTSGRVDARVAITCAGQASARSRRAMSYGAMLAALDGADGAPLAERKWLRIELGEIAARLGDMRAAEAHLRAALALDPGDAVTQVALADFLLDEGRFADARGARRRDRFRRALLRRALAERALGETGGKRTHATSTPASPGRACAARAARAREARFALHLRDDPRAPRARARELRRPARARGRTDPARGRAGRARSRERTAALDWWARTRLEDVRLGALAAELAAFER
jgi:tetratricopeptide (TPR) repeat protein